MIILQGGTGIGTRIANWFANIEVYQWVNKYYKRCQARMDSLGGQVWPRVIALAQSGHIGEAFLTVLASQAYVIFGDIAFSPQEVLPFGDEAVDEIEQFKANPQKYLQNKLHEFGTSPETQAWTETIGTIITEPVVSLLEDYAGQDNPDPHAMARSFHGIASGLPWAAEMVDNIMRFLLGPRAPALGKNIMALYWGLGLGFLGWQTLAPLLSSGLQPNLERYYNRLYRPARFTPSQVRDLFALGRFDAPQLQSYLAEQGWRQDDIQTWIDLSYRQLSEGNVWKLYHEGIITQSQAEDRLRAIGFSPIDIPLLFQINQKEEVEETGRYLRSTAIKAYKEARISEAELREILRGLKYHEREIELTIATSQEQQIEEIRELSTAQIRELYVKRIIGKDEVKHHLAELDYESDVIPKLIEAWDFQDAPKATRLNKATITEAYREGVLSRQQALEMLMTEVGFDQNKADLILKVEDVALARQEEVAPVEAPKASLGLLRQFAAAGLISQDELSSRPEILAYPDQDQVDILELFFITEEVEPVKLSTDVMAQAYVFQLFDRPVFEQYLLGLELPQAEVDLLIDTVELEFPEVFGEFPLLYMKHPALGQVQLALQRGMIDEAGFRARLERQGYTNDAIEIALFNAQYQAPSTPREFTTTQIIRLYKAAKLSRSEALRRLQVIDYTIADATMLIEVEEIIPEDTEIGQAYMAGYISQDAVIAILSEMEFTPEDIQAFLARYPLA